MVFILPLVCWGIPHRPSRALPRRRRRRTHHWSIHPIYALSIHIRICCINGRLGQLRREWNFCVLLLDIIWIWRNNRFAITLHHFYFSDKEDSKIKHVINMKRLSDEQHGRDITAGNHTSEEEMIGTSFKGHGISLSCWRNCSWFNSTMPRSGLNRK